MTKLNLPKPAVSQRSKLQIVIFTLLAIFAVSPYFLHSFVWKEEVTVVPEVYDYRNALAAQEANVAITTTPPLVEPSQLVVPALNVNAQVEFVGMDEKGRMDVPKDDDNVAWWMLGAKPGEPGNAVFAGHFDRKDGGPAVFYDLGKLKTGDEIEITGKDGKNLTFEVYKTEVFKDAEFPIELVFGPTSEKNLNLITCDGVFDQNAKNYSDRLVVFTKLKG